MREAPEVRFADVLTTATSVASLLGEPLVSAGHLVTAVDLLVGAMTIADVGRPASPLIRRPPGGPTVDPAVRSLVQAWWLDLGGDPYAHLDPVQIASFRTALAGLAGEL